MNDINCLDCIHQGKEYRTTCADPNYIKFVCLEFSEDINDVKTPGCFGNSFKPKHKNKVFCINCDKYRFMEDQEPQERCNLSHHVVTGIPAPCKLNRINIEGCEEPKCGIKGRFYKEKELSDKPETHKLTLTRQQAADLCESINLDSEFFDEDDEERLLLKMNNPSLLDAYEVLFTISTEYDK